MLENKLELIDSTLITPEKLNQAQTIIPAQYKRRLSHASRLALTAALTVTETTKLQKTSTIDYIVFGSQHGELDNTVNVLNAISHKETLSPMKFSLAVHNAAAGLYTIIERINTPATSIAAGVDTFLMSMLDAINFLKSNANKTALVVVFDQLLPHCYQGLTIRYDCAYAIALLLRNDTNSDSNICVSMTPYAQGINKRDINATPAALEFYNWCHDASIQHTLVQYSLTQKFSWQS
ncbi:beta-ketoacyl synthase chain length factor [Thiotrichales bacterium 19S3-7]|nr:beta-ketoacyl synthase chain length factor [Thiotrichales bacterium 19S3-7]MCF6802196.1 beta-ketoacyl synthase chain length factor [Thiotrichales bacterium 19S3-11]